MGADADKVIAAYKEANVDGEVGLAQNVTFDRTKKPNRKTVTAETKPAAKAAKKKRAAATT